MSKGREMQVPAQAFMIRVPYLNPLLPHLRGHLVLVDDRLGQDVTHV